MQSQEGTLAEKALDLIGDVMESGHHLMVPWSGGKDSSVVVNLCLQAAIIDFERSGRRVPIIVTHADTGIDNPEISMYVRQEVSKIESFAKIHNLNVEVHISEPTQANTWTSRVIGGRGLPVFPSSKFRDCAIDLKITPMKKLRKKLLSRLSGVTRYGPVTVLGTRFSESSVRKQKMESRGDGAHITEINGERRLSPIAWWDTEDVWSYISECMDGNIKSYSNFTKLFELYSDASEESCAIIADIGESRKQSKACGARFGCMICTATEDKSMRSMLTKPEYAYMRSIYRIQQYILKTRYDWSLRRWIGRTVDSQGRLKIGPDVYSPEMLRNLLRYCLTIDIEEKEAAKKLGMPPRFEMIGPREIITIDAMWSLYGHHDPFEALREYRDIYRRGKRYHVPDVSMTPRSKVPAAQYFYVGNLEDFNQYGDGLYSVADEMFGCIGSRELGNGNRIIRVNTDVAFDVDYEISTFVLEHDLDYILDKFTWHSRTDGYLYHARTGYLILAKGVEGRVDKIMRRTDAISRMVASDAFQKFMHRKEEYNAISDREIQQRSCV